MTVTGFECYKFYLGIKLHFTTEKYDVIKANGRVSAGVDAYNKRRDRMIFEQLAKKLDRPRDAVRYFVANFAYGNTGVIYDKDKAVDILKQWVRVKESLSRVFEKDLETIVNYADDNHLTMNDMFYCTDDNVCGIINLWKGENISIQSVNILTRLQPDLIPRWKSSPNFTLVYGTDLLRIEKLTPFITIPEGCKNAWENFELV